ncbi:MAG: Mrp/NBP35 family ATP-binding protein [Bacteroidales bacterium]|nr:Mrp/NBP35 family ATP-binding protein [Bacteroidales bacterium]MCF8387887.1 Mrp/NBP35 family ATP-binding protein [Bacteroidales bacterium]MCF8398788.1 Mrp/NBP35 family ATP-binding protein [Bacteroidales bacterium]
MNITEEKVLEALQEVIYFKAGDNIVNLKMVHDLKIDGNKISFSLVFPKKVDQSNEIVVNRAKKALKDALGEDLDIEIGIKSEKDIGGGPLASIKNIIAVASGKGGVGKSTVAVNLAIALSKTGAKVGLLDADIYGPSVPTMMDLESQRPNATEKDGKTRILPLDKYDLKVLSIGFFVDPEQALMWRGPMASKALEQLFNDTEWGDLDYLILDMPPGTGDIHLTIAQEYPITGAIIVTTPQKVALADVLKAATMFRQDKIYIPVLGLVENMSYFTPEELPDKKYYLFGKSYSESFAKRLNIPFLGQLPIVEGLAEASDAGKPAALLEDSIPGKAFKELAGNIKKGINALKSK